VIVEDQHFGAKKAAERQMWP